jgi:hypothetical protein
VVAVHSVVELVVDVATRKTSFGFAAARAEIAIVKVLKAIAAAAAGPIDVIAGTHDSFSGVLLAHTV